MLRIEIVIGTPPTAGFAIRARFAPVTRQSGDSTNGEHKSRRGNHRLKNALRLYAFCSLHQAPSKAYYARKRTQGKRHNAATVWLGRRCDAIHAMLRNGTTYKQPRPSRSAYDSGLPAT